MKKIQDGKDLFESVIEIVMRPEPQSGISEFFFVGWMFVVFMVRVTYDK